MGSAKDLITPKYLYENNLTDSIKFTQAAKLFVQPKPHKFGLGGWWVNGKFSVADMKGLIPSQTIPGKNEVLAMMTAHYFENAANDGFQSTYIGMMDKDGNITTVDDLLRRGDTSDMVVMRLAMTPQSTSKENVIAYHKAINDGDISIYVADVECIFRRGLPLGSSTFKKIFKAVNMADGYETVATYDDTLDALNQIRVKVQNEGIEKFPQLEIILDALGLNEVPNPGKMLPKTSFDWTTKYSHVGDLDIDINEAYKRMGVNDNNPLMYEIVNDWYKNSFPKSIDHQIIYSDARGITNIDGKKEVVIAGRNIEDADFTHSPDENRLMVEYVVDGVTLLIPTNKEISRAIFRDRGIYSARDAAIIKHGDQWREHLYSGGFIDEKIVLEATDDSVKMMESCISYIGEASLRESNIFNAPALESWVGDFIPYASRKQ